MNKLLVLLGLSIFAISANAQTSVIIAKKNGRVFSWQNPKGKHFEFVKYNKECSIALGKNTYNFTPGKIVFTRNGDTTLYAGKYARQERRAVRNFHNERIAQLKALKLRSSVAYVNSVLNEEIRKSKVAQEEYRCLQFVGKRN